MKNLIDIDSDLMVFSRKLFDILFLSILWIVCSIPVITTGPATVALYHVSLKMARNEEGNIFSQFLCALKDNLLKGILLSVVYMIGAVLLYCNFFLIVATTGVLGFFLKISFFIAAFSYFGSLFFSFSLQAQFQNTLFGILKNAVILTWTRWIDTVLILGIRLLFVLLHVLLQKMFETLVPLWLLFVPAIIVYLSAKRINGIYIPLINENMYSADDV